MGDEAIYTPEELAILGEETPVVTPPADQELPEGEKASENQPEHTEEEKSAAEKMGLRVEEGFIVDDDGTKIPAKRWKSLYYDYKEVDRGKTETERKFNLYKELGQDKYYAIYPEEAPKDWQAKEAPVEPAARADIGNMLVQGGPHDGK